MSLPVLLSDAPGLDWLELFRELIKGHSWTPRQVSEGGGLPQLLALLQAPPGRLENPSAMNQREILNRLRARAGKPPVLPRREGQR